VAYQLQLPLQLNRRREAGGAHRDVKSGEGSPLHRPLE
jgi:hypothetical protein